MKEFDYYIFIDYSENLIGYSIIEKEKLKELLPKISKFAHYRQLRHKRAYIQSIKKIIEKEKIKDFFISSKICELSKKEACKYFFILGFLDYMKIMDKKAETINKELEDMSKEDIEKMISDFRKYEASKDD